MISAIRDKLPAWLFLLVLVALWETVVRQEWVASYLLPAPSEIYATTVDQWPEIWAATLSTLSSIAWGLTASFSVGVALAIAFFAVPILRRAVLPFCVFFQTVPIIAIAPLLVIWFGFGETTVRASANWPVAMSTDPSRLWDQAWSGNFSTTERAEASASAACPFCM